jgi:hypothetical protein
MNAIYNKKPRKNNFDLSHEVKMTGNMGELYPCYIQDVIPGDSFKVNTQQLVRFSPLLAPMMHNVDFKLDYFFVPYRIVWDEWKDFITGGEDGNDLPSYPRIKIDGTTQTLLTKGSLADYLGVPPLASSAGTKGGAWNDIQTGKEHYISALPFRAYQLIYHEYFRDQNVGDEFEQFTSSGITSATDAVTIMSLKKSNWQKDYFTSALPFLQRGAEVTLPLGLTAPINWNHDSGTEDKLKYTKDGSVLANFDSASATGLKTLASGTVYSDQLGSPSGYGGQWLSWDNSDHLTADLSQATGATINELRKASALQQWLELMARAGSRYREQIHAIFGERIPDYTVQIPKYLGGGKTPIMVSEILSTYEDKSVSTSRPAGDMYGHALGLGDNIGFRQSFNEHGIILGLCRIIPKASYVQGLNKFWQKFDKFDHYFPQFANLGEQEVYKKELYIEGNETDDNQIFGYQQRYAEYKYSENRVAGDFRDTLAHWELSRRFENSAPVLNQSFIECAPDTRIFAITDASEDKCWISLYHKVSAVRPIPYFSNPSLT